MFIEILMFPLLILQQQPPSNFIQMPMYIMESDKCMLLLKNVLQIVQHAMDIWQLNALHVLIRQGSLLLPLSTMEHAFVRMITINNHFREIV